jgi:hypothetical protein
MVGRLTLDQVVKVRVLAPQPQNRPRPSQIVSTDETVGVCFDADRLDDLGRVGIEPDLELMSTDAGRKRTCVVQDCGGEPEKRGFRGTDRGLRHPTASHPGPPQYERFVSTGWTDYPQPG